mmetsp:Transcript_17180/g.31102  ORF Transcript_17180/g.31102 Transcript_17180/m.31102 type:complete len:436 (+) Transcript_17180:67-1374(+)
MLSMEAKDQRIIKSLPGNVVCADCGAANPEWASASFATLLCLDCAGVHRSLGTHISFVRSVTMDSWTEKQLAIMKLGGNQACRGFLEKHGVISTSSTKTDIVDTVKERYSSPAAQLYKQVLIAKYEGKPEPTELPPPMDTNSKKSKTNSYRYQGFGSSLPPPKPNGLTKKTIIRSLIIVGVATAAALLFLPSSHAALLPTRQVASFYDTVGPALDLMAVVEDEPRNYAIHHAQGGLQQKCSSILEIGCGTGRTAESILASFPHHIREYTCIEVSPKMANLTKQRLVKHDNGSDVSVVNDKAIVTVVNDNALTTPWRPSVDCILAFYVLDIMSKVEIQTFLDKALKSLNQNEDGRLVLVSITKPRTTSIAPRIVMGLWEWTVYRFPILLGGCRPIQLTEYISKDEWNVLECTTKSVFGYTSEIVVAAPNPAAIESD